MMSKLLRQGIRRLISQTEGRVPFFIFSLTIIVLSSNHRIIPEAPAIQSTNWSAPQTIPGYEPDTWPPILVTDQNRTVHAFSSQWISSSGDKPIRAIFYNRWSLENGWTNPVDIILSPQEEARLTDVYLDQEGIFHLTFFGGNNTAADIYYTKAPAALAADSRAWSQPIVIGNNAGDPAGAKIIENSQGNIVVVYNGRQLGNGLYLVNSTEGDLNWSQPTPIFFAQSDEPNISDLDVIQGNSGHLHAIWGVYNTSGQGRGIYYSSSEDGTEWREPILLAESNEGLGTQTPAIIEFKDDLIALFNLPPKIMMRYSSDDGKTWEPASILFERHVGVNGSLSLVRDGNNDLHLFFGQRITGNPDIHGLWHSVLSGNRWSEPEAIVKGPQVNDSVGQRSFDPYAARAVVSQGNRILVTWRTDPGLNGNGVWYSSKLLDIPELQVVESTEPDLLEMVPTSVPSETAYAPVTGTLIPVNHSSLLDVKSPSKVWGTGTLIAVGAIPVILIVILLIVMKVFQNRTK